MMGPKPDNFNKSHVNRSAFFPKTDPGNQHLPSNEPSQNELLSPHFKIPVLIANSNFSFNLNKKLKMNAKINDILDISWAVSLNNYHIDLISNRLWISGILIADINYTKSIDSSMHMQTISFPWKKSRQLEFIYPPILPLSNENKQYLLNQDDGHPAIKFYEQISYHNDHPVLQLVSTKVVTSKTISSRQKLPFLTLNITCDIFYQIFQQQILKN